MTTQQQQEQEAQELIAELQDQFADLGEIGVQASRNVPAGKYHLRIENAYLERAKSASGRKQLVAVCTVVATDQGDEHVGKTYFKKWGLETTENLRWLNTDLQNLDMPLPKQAADLVTLCQKLVGVEFTASLVENVGYSPNCYINEGARKLTGIGHSGSGAAVAGNPAKNRF